jgi:nitroreductase
MFCRCAPLAILSPTRHPDAMTDAIPPATLDQLDALLAARHSCRAFLPDPVDPALVERITATAQRVPSWCNAQPWQLIVTRPAATDEFRARLLAAFGKAPVAPDLPFPERYEGVYRDRRRACGWQLYESVGVERGDRAGSARQMRENFRLFGAPHVAIVTTEAALGPYGVLDCGAFITAFMVAARAVGVASIAQAAVAGYAAVVREHFAIPENRQILCGIAFGYEDREHAANRFRTKRADVKEVIDWR